MLVSIPFAIDKTSKIHLTRTAKFLLRSKQKKIYIYSTSVTLIECVFSAFRSRPRVFDDRSYETRRRPGRGDATSPSEGRGGPPRRKALSEPVDPDRTPPQTCSHPRHRMWAQRHGWPPSGWQCYCKFGLTPLQCRCR